MLTRHVPRQVASNRISKGDIGAPLDFRYVERGTAQLGCPTSEVEDCVVTPPSTRSLPAEDAASKRVRFSVL